MFSGNEVPLIDGLRVGWYGLHHRDRERQPCPITEA